MIRAVLFDLDDTLLRLNLTAFVARYVAGASRLLASAARVSPVSLGVPYVRAFLAMDDQGREDSLTNEQLFNKTILETTGIPLDDPVIADLMTYYETELVPGFAGRRRGGAARRGRAREAIEAVHDAGLICALATNPHVLPRVRPRPHGLGGRGRERLRARLDLLQLHALQAERALLPGVCQPARRAPRRVPHGRQRRRARHRARRLRAAHGLRRSRAAPATPSGAAPWSGSPASCPILSPAWTSATGRRRSCQESRATHSKNATTACAGREKRPFGHYSGAARSSRHAQVGIIVRTDRKAERRMQKVKPSHALDGIYGQARRPRALTARPTGRSTASSAQ